MTTETKLADCPFCGSTEASAQYDRSKRRMEIHCSKCGAMGPLTEQHGTAIAAWNQRTAKTYEQGLEDCLLLVREAQENIFGPTTRQAVLTELDNNIRAIAKGDL